MEFQVGDFYYQSDENTSMLKEIQALVIVSNEGNTAQSIIVLDDPDLDDLNMKQIRARFIAKYKKLFVEEKTSEN